MNQNDSIVFDQVQAEHDIAQGALVGVPGINEDKIEFLPGSHKCSEQFFAGLRLCGKLDRFSVLEIRWAAIHEPRSERKLLLVHHRKRSPGAGSTYFEIARITVSPGE